MPKPKLWTILHSAEDKCLYIKSGEDVRRDYGALLDVRCSKERDDVVKVRLDYVVQYSNVVDHYFEFTDQVRLAGEAPTVVLKSFQLGRQQHEPTVSEMRQRHWIHTDMGEAHSATSERA